MSLSELLDLSVPALVMSLTASAASLMAVILGLQHLLSGPRLRRQESTLREAVAGTENENQRRILRSMHAAAVGQLVARDAVPSLAFLRSGTIVAVAILWAFTVSLWEPYLWNLETLGASAVLGWFGVKGGLRLVSERMRVARAYTAGESPVRGFTDLLAKVEGGRKWESTLSFIASAGLVVAIARASSALRVDEVTTWGHVFPMVAGVSAVTAALQVAWSLINSEDTKEPQNPRDSLKVVWLHPRGAAAAPGTDVSGPRPEPEVDESAPD